MSAVGTDTTYGMGASDDHAQGPGGAPLGNDSRTARHLAVTARGWRLTHRQGAGDAGGLAGRDAATDGEEADGSGGEAGALGGSGAWVGAGALVATGA